MESILFAKSSNIKKKYDAYIPKELWNAKRKDKIQLNYKKVSFGSSLHEQYRDDTPNKEFSHLNHLDKDRRKRYYQRFGNNPRVFSPMYFSHHFLWSKKN